MGGEQDHTTHAINAIREIVASDLQINISEGAWPVVQRVLDVKPKSSVLKSWGEHETSGVEKREAVYEFYKPKILGALKSYWISKARQHRGRAKELIENAQAGYPEYHKKLHRESISSYNDGVVKQVLNLSPPDYVVGEALDLNSLGVIQDWYEVKLRAAGLF